MDSVKFVAALDDNYKGYTYRNTTNQDKFVAALEDNYTGYYYKNNATIEKFVTAMEDDYKKTGEQTRFANTSDPLEDLAVVIKPFETQSKIEADSGRALD